MRFLLIEHPDGRRYAVTPEVFVADYEPLGFTTSGYEDGSPYEAATAEPAVGESDEE